MDFLLILAAAYVVIAAGSAVLTVVEYLSSAESTPPYFALGLMACLVWPATFTIVMIAARNQPQPIAVRAGARRG